MQFSVGQKVFALTDGFKPWVKQGEKSCSCRVSGLISVCCPVVPCLVLMPSSVEILMLHKLRKTIISFFVCASCSELTIKATIRLSEYQSTIRAAGTYTEYVAVQEDNLAAQPDSLSFEEAAAVPLAALTAFQVRYPFITTWPPTCTRYSSGDNSWRAGLLDSHSP